MSRVMTETRPIVDNTEGESEIKETCVFDMQLRAEHVD